MLKFPEACIQVLTHYRVCVLCNPAANTSHPKLCIFGLFISHTSDTKCHLTRRPSKNTLSQRTLYPPSDSHPGIGPLMLSAKYGQGMARAPQGLSPDWHLSALHPLYSTIYPAPTWLEDNRPVKA